MLGCDRQGRVVIHWLEPNVSVNGAGYLGILQSVLWPQVRVDVSMAYGTSRTAPPFTPQQLPGNGGNASSTVGLSAALPTDPGQPRAQISLHWISGSGQSPWLSCGETLHPRSRALNRQWRRSWTPSIPKKSTAPFDTCVVGHGPASTAEAEHLKIFCERCRAGMMCQ